ncbi:MAG TPA: transposase [Chloroflexi bacterium]|nr:transposase [Chloroflexota bacterium]
MDEEIAFSARAGLVALGMRFQRLGLWAVVAEHVKIKQKVLVHTPLEKLLDCFINILAGGSGLIEINTRVRPDRAVQRAFGRRACAEQSTISDTLNACTPENVAEMRTALKAILRHHGQSYAHNYEHEWQLLDIDTTGMPAGRQGEGVTKGYFAKQKNRRGRQLGRVVATQYEELIVDRLYPGKRQLNDCLQALLTTTEDVLDLDEPKRKRTIVRVDAGGGEDKDINWLLARDYHILVKVKNWRRAEKLAASVLQWYADSKLEDREVGWVQAPHPYTRPTRQLAVRSKKADGSRSHHVLVLTLTDEMLFQLGEQAVPSPLQPVDGLLAALQAYDRRGGGIETQNRADKQGLGLTHRNKQRFAAQEMLVLLAHLAHNLVIWTRNDLAQADQRFHKYGIHRTVRDAFQIPGAVLLDSDGHIQGITLNQLHPLAGGFHSAFAALDDLPLNLGQI